MTYTASKECAKELCRGTAFFDTACKDYVCNTCGTHYNGDCSRCNWRDKDEGFTPEEENSGA